MKEEENLLEEYCKEMNIQDRDWYSDIPDLESLANMINAEFTEIDKKKVF